MEIVTLLNQFLAPLFENLKAKNPTIAMILAVVLITVNLNIDAILLAVGITNQSLAGTIKLLLLAISTLMGSKTFQFLPENAQLKATAKRKLK